MQEKLYIIDAHNLIYRAYYAFINRPLTNSKGENTSAIFGFTRMLLKLMKIFNPKYLLISFDSPVETFRHKKYKEYKAQREEMPDDMKKQIPMIKELVKAFNIKMLEMPGFEADDIIGTVAEVIANEDVEVDVLTKDKDIMQLVNDKIKVLYPSKDAGSDIDFDIIDREMVKEKLGVFPEQVCDLLALMGDSSDNIPGIKGIGPKTAIKLIESYGGVESLFENLENISNEKLREKVSEGKESAFLSKELVTIKTDIDYKFNLEDFKVSKPDRDKVTEIFNYIESKSLFAELDWMETSSSGNYHAVSSTSEFRELLKKAEEAGFVSIDLETTHYQPMQAEIIGFAFSFKSNEGYYVPVKSEGLTLFSEGISLNDFINTAKPFLENEDIKKVGQNIKYDHIILKRNGINTTGIAADTMLASYVINPSISRHNMDFLAEQYLGYKTITYTDLVGKGKNKREITQVPIPEMTKYAAEDADITLRLYEYFIKKINADKSISKVYNEIEMPLLYVLTDMEMAGVKIDTGKLRKLSLEFEKEIIGLEENIFKLSGETFNIQSPKQLREILFNKMGLPVIKKTKTGPSTDEEVLRALSKKSEIADYIYKHRQISKLKNTYLDALPKMINEETGRIHSSFNQTVTATGRLSSSDPNLQNIPVRGDDGKKIREAFITEAGYTILSVDYSQIELRILAHYSNDKNLIEAFRNGKDIHNQTASIVFGVPEDEVGPDMRRQAKTINFGIIYGLQPFGLSKRLGIPIKIAEQSINDYLEKFSGIASYIQETREFLKKNGYVETLFGRRRYISGYDSKNKRDAEAHFREAINMPIQGTAADIIKLSMIDIHNKLQDKKSRMIMQIHDELVFEIADEELDDLQNVIRESMEGVCELNVPLTVELGIGKNWFSAH